jgi:hypothetical protein
VPVIAEKAGGFIRWKPVGLLGCQAPRSNLPEIEKKKFLVPGTMSLGLVKQRYLLTPSIPS